MGSTLIFRQETKEGQDTKDPVFDIPLGNQMFFHQLCSSRPQEHRGPCGREERPVGLVR